MAYLGELIREGVFKEIYVSFLPVGHTHEDVDQMFSRFAMAIRVRDTVILTEMCQVFSKAYKTREGLYPAVHVVNSVANISDHVDGITSCWNSYGIAQYYQFHISAETDSETDPESERNLIQPRVRARQSTVGDELFRGLFKHAFHSCEENSPIFDEPHQKIEWDKICPSQRKERNEKALAEYVKTIEKGYEQWGYDEEQLTGLIQMWDLLNSEEPLPFHWLVNESTSTLGYPLWPCITNRGNHSRLSVIE